MAKLHPALSRIFLLAMAATSAVVSAAPAVKWALADFDGDLKIDVATASSGRRDARGYAQEVSVDLDSTRHSSFNFRTRSATIELNSFDIDGDHDRDLIILDSLSKQPIGVWLNDGSGSFSEAKLSDFQAALLQRNAGPSLLAARMSISLLALSEDRIQLALPLDSAPAPRRAVAPLARPRAPARRDAFRSDLHSRAP